MALFEIEELEQISPLFRGKAGHAFAKGLLRLLGIERIQEGYDRNDCYEGPEFASHILEEFGVRYTVGGPGLGMLPEGPFITVSNHPYGSIDGLALVDVFGHIRPDFKVMVNKFLGRVKALEPSFIKVTPTGTEKKSPDLQTMSGIREALRHVRDGHPLGLFPAGAVSDLSLKDRCIRDREWQEPILRFIRKAGLPVVPVRFFDRNSDFFYLLGLIDWRVRVLRLPHEVLNKVGRQIRIGVGLPVSPEEQAACSTLEEFGALLRNSVYSMSPCGEIL
ncbi:MAG: lysophospholipid acyltransferase family protein [Candidatus Cryptobacteroides sp.]